jgi:biopolymer transport protein ExbD
MIKIQNLKREPFRLDLIPMINIVFLLLIFFLLTSTAIKQSKEVNLPEAQSSQQIEKQNVIISILSNGSIALGKENIKFESLLSELSKILIGKKEKLVEIQADKNIEFKLFGKVIDIAKQAGAVDFILATELPNVPGK